MTANTANFPFAIKSVEGEIGLGYTRLIVLEHNGAKFHVRLKWDIDNGFEITFLDGLNYFDETPDWFEDVDLLEFDEMTEDLMPKKELPPTAADQFVHDYLLVVMNYYEGYQRVMKMRDEFKSTNDFAEWLEADFETKVADITEVPSVTSSLLREMLMNQGLDVWYRIAKEIIENV